MNLVTVLVAGHLARFFYCLFPITHFSNRHKLGIFQELNSKFKQKLRHYITMEMVYWARFFIISFKFSTQLGLTFGFDFLESKLFSKIYILFKKN